MRLPATERLYYRDASRTEFEASIIDLDASRTRAVLDQSAFYPTSGGQPCDMGTLADVAVVDVTEDGDSVVHHLATPLPEGVTSVTGRVDWARRLDHMQQHTGQHLLSALLEDHFGWPTVSVHFGAESGTLDLGVESVPPQLLREAERLVNGLVTENRPVSITFEAWVTAAGLRKPSERDGMLRIVSIEGIDKNACGGTHVSRTGAIGPILLRRAERMRGTTRVEFRCGARAIARARADYDIGQQLAALFSTSVDEVPAIVTALQADARAADKERTRLAESLAANEAQALYERTVPDALGRRVHTDMVHGAPVNSRLHAAQQFTRHANALYLAVSDTPPALLLAASADTGLDCGRLLKDALHSVGGRGGGTSALAQGSAPSFDAVVKSRDHVVALLNAPRHKKSNVSQVAEQ